MKHKYPTQALLEGRRSFDHINGVELLEDWIWNDIVKRWVLHCRLSLEFDKPSLIPQKSDWYVLVEESYPWGNIKFYPAKVNGITQTFPHQSYNSEGAVNIAWRTGDICLDTSVQILKKEGYNIEPYTANSRLTWRVLRALEWLKVASKAELVIKGEPFELPAFPENKKTNTKIAFSENLGTFEYWMNIHEDYGLFEMVNDVFGGSIITNFKSITGQTLLKPVWGIDINTSRRPIKHGLWIRIPQVPIYEIWQAPITWGQLRSALRQQGIKIDHGLRPLFAKLRDGESHIGLIGFPIPRRLGETPSTIHWQAFLIPALSQKSNTIKGFRANSNGHWYRDRTHIIQDHVRIDWLASENWHQEQISTRGRIINKFAQKKILIIGAGALGSVISELLVRSSVHNLKIMDADIMEVGNLVRHVLTASSIGNFKAKELSHRLNSISPNVSTISIISNFPPDSIEDKNSIEECNIIIDCTGSDELLYDLEQYDWTEEKIFISLSLGVGARRLFCFYHQGQSFPLTIFRTQIAPWLKKDLDEWGDVELPREGIGCWHPIFPARLDDIFMLASSGIKDLEIFISQQSINTQLTVFEQLYEDNSFIGVKKSIGGIDE